MKLSANEAISVVDKLTKLDMKSATSAQELAQALSKVANSARLAKVSQDEILGILSVGIETTQQSGDVIGTAVRSLLARFSNVKASKFGGSGEETEGTLNDTEAVLSKIGIRIRSASGEMRSFMDVLDDVAEKWDTLDDVSRNAISTAMAGTRQKEIFASIIENYDRVKELTEESANAAGTADEKYSAYMDSMEAATKRLQNAWEGFTQSLETSTVMKFLTNATAAIVENADKLKYLVTYITAAGSARIFDFFTNKGETGGWKGLVANIPFIGRGTRTNNILENIDKKVGDIRGEVKKDKNGATKNGSLINRIKNRVDQYKQHEQDKKFVKDYEKEKNFYLDRSLASAYSKNRKIIKGYSKKAQYDDARLIKQMKADKVYVSDYEKNIIGNASSASRDLNMRADAAKKKKYQLSKQRVEDENLQKEYNAAQSRQNALKSVKSYRDAKRIADKKIAANKKEYKAALLRLKLDKEARMEAFAQTAAASGIATLATQLMTTKQVSGYGQTVEETGGDKALRAGLATAGSVAGAASALIPVIGPMIAPIVSSLGSIAGGGLAGLISKWFHKDELQMKQRVAEAKENLGALKQIQTTLESNDNILTKDEYESSDYAKLETVVDSLRDILSKNKGLANAFLEDVNKLGIGDYNNLEEIYYKIIEGNAKINKQLQRQLVLTSQRLKIENLYASYEKERKEISDYVGETRVIHRIEATEGAKKAVARAKERGYAASELKEDEIVAGGGGVTWNDVSIDVAGDTIYEQAENAERILEELILQGDSAKDLAKEWEKVVLKYNNLVAKQTKIDDDLLEARAQYAYSMTDVTKVFTRNEIREMGREGVIKEIAKELSNQGVDILDDQGVMHKDAYDAINKFIKADELLSLYLEQDVRSIGELVSTKNQQGIEDFARAFGITAEEAEKLGEKFGYLTQSMGLMNVEEVTEYYEKLGNVFSELGSTAALSATQINKMLSDSNLQDLLPYLMNQDDPDALIKELYKRIYGGGQDFHMENALYDATMNMSTEGFRDFLQNQGSEELVKALDDTGYTTLSQIREAVYKLDESNPKRQKFLEYLETINYTYAKDLTALEKPAEYIKSQLESQISNLQEQKDALSQINDEREKELNLIKARQALEDARKEKRRVYRQGVGFVMESNEEAIAEAQKNLENLNVEKQQERIQAQIDALQLQKDILEALPNQAELEQTKKIWELWAADKNVDGSLASVSERVSMMADAYSDATTTMNMAAKTLDWLGRPKEGKGPNLSSERTDMTADLTKDEIEAQNASLGNLDKNVFGIAEELGVENAVEPKKSGEGGSADKNASGTKAFKGGRTFINELGTEAVITPGGTLTALPSKTGIVPADITRNVWALGEIAPTLVAQLSSLNQKAFAGNAGNTTYEEGQYIDNLTMNVYPTKDYDMDKLLSEARAKARLTRHSN